MNIRKATAIDTTLFRLGFHENADLLNNNINIHEVNGKTMLLRELDLHAPWDTPIMADLVNTQECTSLIDRRNNKEEHA